jgi:hypothetical protein
VEDTPVLRSHDLQDADIMVVVMSIESLGIERRDVDVRLHAKVKLPLQFAAVAIEVRKHQIPVVDDDRVTAFEQLQQPGI